MICSTDRIKNKPGEKEVPYWYQLERYFLDIEIPVKAIRKLDNMELQAVIHISFGYYEHDNENNQARRYFEMRQETYLCEEYELRNRCQGYRGYVAGVNCS